MSCEDHQSMSSSADEETIVFYSLLPWALHELASEKTVWHSAAEEEEEEDVNDITPCISPPCAPIASYYQDLALKLSSGGRRSISIVSDNPFSHSVVNGLPSLPPLYEYSAMDEFLPSLLIEKGLSRTLSIVSDNASSSIPDTVQQCSSSVEESHSSLDDELSLDIIVEQPYSECHVETVIVVDKAIQEMDRNARVGRSNSYNAIFSTPKSKPKRSVARARSFQGHNKGALSPSVSNKSPQSVLDIFNTADAEELRSSFSTL